MFSKENWVEERCNCSKWFVVPFPVVVIINKTSSNVSLNKTTSYIHSLLQINIFHSKLNTSPVNTTIGNTKTFFSYSSVHTVSWPLLLWWQHHGNAMRLSGRREASSPDRPLVVPTDETVKCRPLDNIYDFHVPTFCSLQERFSATGLNGITFFWLLFRKSYSLHRHSLSLSRFSAAAKTTHVVCSVRSIVLAVVSYLSLEHSVRPWRGRW
jgi:hypothetical protein